MSALATVALEPLQGGMLSDEWVERVKAECSRALHAGEPTAAAKEMLQLAFFVKRRGRDDVASVLLSLAQMATGILRARGVSQQRDVGPRAAKWLGLGTSPRGADASGGSSLLSLLIEREREAKR